MQKLCLLERRVPLVVAAAFGLAACGSTAGPVGKQPSWRKPSVVQGADGARGPVVFAPRTEPAPRYNDPPVVPAPSTPLGDAIGGALGRLAAEAGVAVPRGDGRLYRAADELAAVVPQDAPTTYPLPAPLVEFALHRQGVIEPAPHMLVIWGALDEPDEILDQLDSQLPELLADGEFDRYGVGMSRRDGDEGVAIVVLQSSHLTTSPIPRELPDGGMLAIEGQVRAGYRNPEIFITREDGAVVRAPSGPENGQRFRHDMSCAGRSGRQQVEITAIGDTGSTVLANFPVWCNARAPRAVTIEVSEDELRPAQSPAEAETRMLALLNEDRARHDLPPLALDPRVAAVARAYSEEMHETGVVAHVSPTTGSAADRVKNAGIRTAVVLENLARAYGVHEAQEGLMNSPGHRANILSRHATHIGIGIVFGEEVAGRREMFVTQVFTRVPPRIRPDEVKQRVHAKVGAARTIGHDDGLAALAQRYAAAVAAGTPTETAAKGIASQLQPFAARYRKVATVVTIVADVEAFNPDSVFTDPATTNYGLGLAQGDHEVLGDGAIFMVILVAQAR